MSNLDALRAALAESPENVALLRLYAQSCLDELTFDEAKGCYEKILRIDSDDPEARLGICRVLFFEGKTSEAAIRAEALIGDVKDFASAHVFLSRLYLSESDLKLAASHYDQALAINKASADPALERDLGMAVRSLQRSRQENEKNDSPDTSVPSAPTLTEWNASENATGLDYDPGSDSLFDDDDDGDDDDLFDRNLVLHDFERPKVNFSDVGGMDVLKEEIRMKILYPIQHRDMFRAYGKKVGGGVLLYGPPGCGKTLVSRATAGEIDANFFSLGIHQILDMYIGNSEKNLHQIFQMARDNAPAVLFFDEVDALAADRKDMRQSAGRTVINQFLADMDGSESANEGVLIIGATNAPWHMDPAFRRPGRFDRVIFVPPPDEGARRSIIDVLARDKPVSDLDVGTLAKKTRNFSGADLKALFDLAAEEALSQAMGEGRIVPISNKSLVRLAKSVKPSTKPWFESAKNYAIYANQSGFYDDVLRFLGIKS